MIPKIIHYIWFGNGKMPKLERKCVKSFSKNTGFEIERWDESNFDVNCNQWCREAYAAKKYAFVADYARLWILYNYGGVYLDTDCEMIKSLEPLLNQTAFLCYECSTYIAAGTIGAVPHIPIIKKVLDWYDSHSFILEDGSLNTLSITRILANIFSEYGFVPNGKEQVVEGIRIYPVTYFCPTNLYNRNDFTENTYINHHWHATWMPDEYKKARRHDKNPIIRFLRKTPIIKIYYKLCHRN